MTHHRTSEIIFGVIALLCVISIPIPLRRNSLAVNPEEAHVNLQQLEGIRSAAQSQRTDLINLAVQTRRLSEVVRTMDAAVEPLRSPHPPTPGIASVPRGPRNPSVPRNLVPESPRPPQPQGIMGSTHTPCRPGMEPFCEPF